MIRLLSGDCRDVLATLPAESVQCVVTSPPYLGLRDYQTASWNGGDAACDHQRNVSLRRDSPGGFQNSTSRGTQVATIAVAQQFRDTCGKCGAVRVDRQIGLEATPDEYLATMVGVFRQIRRVMRNDAVAFINMGDSYSDKNLLLMPARLALALQADGWWVRSDVIWCKPNPMPESCRDRPTSAHEHVFLITKSARYFYDADAVREEAEYGASVARDGAPNGPFQLATATGQFRGGSRAPGSGGSRNLRNVWTIATHAYPDAHFATFPPELAERCIKAGTSERGCCAACGKPWQRLTDTSYTDAHRGMVGNQRKAVTDERVMHAGRENDVRMDKHVATTGWSSGCQCGGATVPCAVLDPFAGAGTTLLVADRLQRDAIGIELNTAYTEMAMERCRQDAPLFTSFPPAEDPEEMRMADLFTDMAAD